MRAEFRNFARRLLADVNRDADNAGQSARENESDEPGRYVSDPQRGVEGRHTLDRGAGVEKDFRDPRNHDQDEDENVIAFQAPPDCFQFSDLERRQDEIFADEFFPFAL